MFSFLSVYLSGASLILLLTASEAQYDSFTSAPDYDSDYNATFEYSFYSNASHEDLERFSERFIEGHTEEDTGGWEEEVTVTTATTQRTTERGDVLRGASLPVSLDIRTLAWTLLILIGLNIQQLLPTLRS